MIQLHQDFGGIPVILVRFNPDKYKCQGQVIKSYIGRENILLNLLNGLKNRKEWTIPLSIYYLFYDGYKGMPE